MAKTTVKRDPAKAATRRTANPGTITADLQPRLPTEEKVTNTILMLAADDEGMTFLVNKSSREFYVPLDDPNYAAKTSTLLSAHANGGTVAVKYTEPAIAIVGNRRRATAVAKGVHAVISGGSF